jgi:hypothetical protein
MASTPLCIMSARISSSNIYNMKTFRQHGLEEKQWRAAMIPVDALAFLSACRSGYKVAWQLEWMIFSLEGSLARPMTPNVFMWPIYPAQLFENVRWRKWTGSVVLEQQKLSLHNYEYEFGRTECPTFHVPSYMAVGSSHQQYKSYSS